jgi:hypothetical protein
MPDNGFSQKPKYVASNKTDKIVFVTGGLHFPSAVYIYYIKMR